MSSTTRDKIIQAAEELMLTRGYPATRVDEICEAAGVSKGSFYHFFPTKEDLGLAVLEAFAGRNDQLIAGGPQGAVADPVERALTLVDHITEIAGELWGRGCLLGNFALDLGDTNPRIHQAVSNLFRKVAHALAGGMDPLTSSDGVAAASSGQDLAEHFIIVVEGALILAKAHNDWSYVVRALDRFRRDIRRPVRQST
jgi:TetR/AcrR family transcriptional repressor of nem operon